MRAEFWTQSQTVTVHYTDTTSTQFRQSFSDWYTPQNYAGESEAVAMAYRNFDNGTKDSRTFNLYAYHFTLDSKKVVQSIISRFLTTPMLSCLRLPSRSDEREIKPLLRPGGRYVLLAGWPGFCRVYKKGRTRHNPRPPSPGTRGGWRAPPGARPLSFRPGSALRGQSRFAETTPECSFERARINWGSLTVDLLEFVVPCDRPADPTVCG